MKMFGKFVTTSAAAAALMFAGTASADTVLDATNYQDVNQGDVVEGFDTFTWNFTGMQGSTGNMKTFGTLDSRVLHDGDNPDHFIYEYRITPSGDLNDSLNEFRTNWNVIEWGLVDQGWDFGESGAANGRGNDTDFEISQTSGMQALRWTLDRERGDNWNWQGEDEAISFFFRSETAPGQIRRFQLNNDGSGFALGYAPVPTPAAAAAGLPLLGLLGAGYAIRRRRQQS